MILQALVEYYNRKKMDPNSDIAPPGFEQKEIPFIIIIDSEGRFVGIEDTREKIGKKLVGKKFKVPQSIKRTRQIDPNYLWDNASYLFGISNSEEKESENCETNSKKRESFLNNLKGLFPHLLANTELNAVVSFLEGNFLRELEKDPLWGVICEEIPNVTFKIYGNKYLVSQNPEIERAISKQFEEIDETREICLITGEIDAIARLHPSIKGVYGSKQSGGNLVSINFDSAESYNKTQGFNSPVGVNACFAYTTALNYLLKSPQKIAFGDSTTIIFWAAKDNQFEEILLNLLDSNPQDDPDRQTKAVESLFNSPKSGAFSTLSDETKFHVLGLSPNDARLAIRLWWTSTVKELAGNIQQHFEDLTIGIVRNKSNCFSIYRLLQGCALKGDFNSLSPRLTGDFLNSIFSRNIYPHNLLILLLRRIRDEEGISTRRAALIKGWINRYTRKNQKHEKELHVILDESNNNPGYCLGRLFAVLEKIQEEAHDRNLNTTIRDRFYSAASTTPITVFPNLMKLKNHHLAKLENRGRSVNFEKTIGEIMQYIEAFPPVFSLADQGRFAIGYYHQKQNFYTKNQE
jgi:CRISPR-associated protein Csd1